MKITIRFIFVALLITSNIFSAGAFLNKYDSIDNHNEFETLMKKIRQDFAQNPHIEEALKKYNEKDGSFTDIDYSSIQRTKWQISID